MTILSVAAYTAKLKAILTMSRTFDADPNAGGWNVPHATTSAIKPNQHISPVSHLRTIGKEDGPISTVEILTEVSYDNVGGQGFSGVTLWSDGASSHLVTPDVKNILDIFDEVFKVIATLPGLKGVEREDILLHVNDFNSTSALTRADSRFIPNFGSQCQFICPNGKVVCFAFDRVTVNSTNSNKYAWRAMSVKEGHVVALMKSTPDGFDYEPATGYITAVGVRIPYFVRQFTQIDQAKPNPHSYAWALIKPNAEAAKASAHSYKVSAATAETDAVD